MTLLEKYDVRHKKKYTELRIRIGKVSCRTKIEQKFFELINFILREISNEGEGNA